MKKPKPKPSKPTKPPIKPKYIVRASCGKGKGKCGEIIMLPIMKQAA